MIVVVVLDATVVNPVGFQVLVGLGQGVWAASFVLCDSGGQVPLWKTRRSALTLKSSAAPGVAVVFKSTTR